uniref:CD81 molecule b n=1 Tax=Cyprinodon variegatus TaxID=28743 RepID=A0A3Q2CJU4_CYPVA
MAVAGCTKCIKYMLFFFNFIFWLAGGVILGVALWLRHDSQTSNLLILQFEGQQAPSTFYISVYILIAVGAVMMLVGFLGCYGAIQESQCLLGTFFFFLVILFASEVAAAIWGFMNKDTMSKELINFYDAAYIKAVDVSGSPSKDAAVSVLGAFHTTLNCCGKGDDTTLFQQVRNTLCPAQILSSPIPKVPTNMGPLNIFGWPLKVKAIISGFESTIVVNLPVEFIKAFLFLFFISHRQ